MAGSSVPDNAIAFNAFPGSNAYYAVRLGAAMMVSACPQSGLRVAANNIERDIGDDQLHVDCDPVPCVFPYESSQTNSGHSTPPIAPIGTRGSPFTLDEMPSV